MATPFLGEIKIVPFNFAPKGWALCNGALMPINQNQALFSLLGTTYGGDGRVTFGLPNLQGRAPTHVGPTMSLGQAGGEQTHTLSLSELPMHAHTANGSSSNGNMASGSGTVLAGALNAYGAPTNLTALTPSTIATTGGSQPHNNMQPFLALNFCIALVGIFPSQN